MDTGFSEILTYGGIFGIMVMSVVLHEVAHGYMALRMGDTTALYMGRITLNPLAHIDPFMTLLLPLFLLVTAGFFFGGAKPVPINPLRFQNLRKGILLTALAGPLTNFAIAIAMAVLLLLSRLLAEAGGIEQKTVADKVFSFCIVFNICLGCFNLIPIPPLDGSRVVSSYAPLWLSRKLDQIEPYGIFILFALIMFTPVLDVVILPAALLSWLLGAL